jgi:hypothetical protein
LSANRRYRWRPRTEVEPPSIRECRQTQTFSVREAQTNTPDPDLNERERLIDAMIVPAGWRAGVDIKRLYAERA